MDREWLRNLQKEPAARAKHVSPWNQGSAEPYTDRPTLRVEPSAQKNFDKTSAMCLSEELVKVIRNDEERKHQENKRMKQLEKDVEALQNEKATLQNEKQKLESKCQQTDELLETIEALKNENSKYKEDLRRKQDDVSSVTEQPSVDSTLPVDSDNPTIPDLSDPNRPMKMGEKYTELFDNEWTDAMEKLCEYEEDESKNVQKLIDILKKCYKTCVDISEKQMESLLLALVNPLGSGKLKYSRKEAVTPSTHHHLKNFRRDMSSYAVDIIYKELASDIFWYEVKTVPYFVRKCIELCWLMCVQDPPVVIGGEATVGVTFDTNLYKLYTNAGTVVSYNVWPPLLLHENGPILVRGVVQPQKVEKKKHRGRNNLDGIKASMEEKQQADCSNTSSVEPTYGTPYTRGTDLYRSGVRDPATSRNISGQKKGNQITQPSSNDAPISVCPYTGHKLIQSKGVTYIKLLEHYYDYDEYKRLIIKREESNT